MIGAGGDLPASRSQASKWTQAVRHRLPDWIRQNVQPVLQAALTRERLDARLELGGQENDKLLLHYPALAQGTGYVAPVVTLEFGARATSEPHQVFQVTCDIAEHLPGVSFPAAAPLVMSVARTFWEKATAVARHKSYFFIEKDADGQVIDYLPATRGHLKIVPEAEARTALAKDYAAMLADEVMLGNALSFNELLNACDDLETKVNKAAA